MTVTFKDRRILQNLFYQKVREKEGKKEKENVINYKLQIYIYIIINYKCNWKFKMFGKAIKIMKV